MPRKTKLTLSVDAETVEKAKRLGINMSEITETVLRTQTFDPKQESWSKIREGYEALFEAMRPLVREYGISLKIGEVYQTSDDIGEDLYLEWRGYNVGGDSLPAPLDEVLEEHDGYSFLRADEILKALINELAAAREMRKERAQSLVLVQRVVEALTDELGVKRHPATMRKGSGRVR